MAEGSQTRYRSSGADPRGQPLSAAIRAAAEPLPEPGETGFAKAFDRFAGKRVVLLGEATHGTSEFYHARSAITRHLVEKHGFTIVAVEADWPDAAMIDRQARGLPPHPDQPTPFERFPVWMWRNAEMVEFFAWMRRHNSGRPRTECCRFYGLDMYNLTASIASVLTYLEGVDPAAAATAREHYGCLTPWQHDPSTYGRAVLTDAYRKCEESVVEQCRTLLEKQLEYEPHDREGFLDAAQNARLVAAAERYYRVMFYGG
ncbi:MAG TPA: erythromycin esterase family protein, partial [Rhizobium sp.]|nr:erythromycin esterase family protein [Rhizobium sp.]